MYNNYFGKKCPLCNKEFSERDEIVECSVCNLPHHKACWKENIGCTTFGCHGSMREINESNNESTNKIKYCGKCGNQNNAQDGFCTACGAQLATVVENKTNYSTVNSSNTVNSSSTVNSNTVYRTDNNSRSIFSQMDEKSDDTNEQNKTLFIGNNAQSYLNKFKNMEIQNKQTSWNWPAFLFTAYWFYYRKLYKVGSLIIAILSLSLFLGWLKYIIVIGVTIYSGIMGDYHYKEYVEDEMIHAQRYSDNQKNLYFQQKGGTSVGAIFAALAILLLVGFFRVIVITVMN